MDLIATKNNNALDCNSEEKTKFKTYKRRRVCHGGSSIPDELVYEILLRLPVRTLARSKSVWCATISNPSFIGTHLKQQQPAISRHEQKLSFLITQHTLDTVIDDEPRPSTFSNIIPFYRWQEGQHDAHLVRATDLRWGVRVGLLHVAL
uniref:F-box domain-containing protein n=1 Tax=Oryza punctata TaxID=4537 RepID=A0A0E0LAR2_ORYPU